MNPPQSPEPLKLFRTAPADGAPRDERAFEELIERWRMMAFDVYAAVRGGQRERTSVSARVDALRSAGETASTLSSEVALLCFAAGALDENDIYAVPA